MKTFRGAALKQLVDLAVLMDEVLKKTLVLSLGVEMEAIDFEKGETAEGVLINQINDLKRKIQWLFWEY